MDALQRVGRVARDRLAGRDVAGERDEPRRRDARRAARPTGTPSPVTTCSTPARDDLLRELHEAEQRERRLLGRLEDLDVAGRERRPHLPDGHHQRVVPRADAADDPERLAPDHRRVARDVLAGRLALEIARGAREEAEVVGGERHLVARGHQRLADVDATRAARAPRRSPRARRRACAGAPSAPSASSSSHSGERGLRRLDRAVDVLRAAARHLGDRLAGRRG